MTENNTSLGRRNNAVVRRIYGSRKAHIVFTKSTTDISLVRRYLSMSGHLGAVVRRVRVS